MIPLGNLKKCTCGETPILLHGLSLQGEYIFKVECICGLETNFWYSLTEVARAWNYKIHAIEHPQAQILTTFDISWINPDYERDWDGVTNELIAESKLCIQEV